MMRTLTKSLTALLLATALYPAAASAALARVGPVSPVHGFPEWFQDDTGITLELCVPSTVAEFADGWCFAEPPDTTSPEVFPTNWSVEHFWWSADAVGTYAGDRVLLVLAVESTFANEVVQSPDQIAFGRLRIRLDTVPVSGTYKFTTPYGVFFEEGTAGDRIFATRDLGLTGCVPGDFTCTLNSDIGPFLLPADANGNELPPVTNPATGKKHIADPGRIGPVTGSPFNTNYFEVEGPVGAPPAVRINDFAMTGRIFEGTIPARATVDRASYSRTAGGNSIDAYATAFATQPGRLPASPAATAVTPALSFYAAACSGGPDATPPSPYGAPVGATAVAMSRNEFLYFAKTAPATLPNSVCVAYTNPTNGVGAALPPVYMPGPLGDQVFISAATYNQATQTLTVSAASSDTVAPPVLQVGAFGGTPTDFLTGGIVTIPGVTAPPSKVRVISSAGGVNELQVATSEVSVAATGVTLTASSPSPHAAGTPVVFTATATGGVGAYQYRFFVFDGASWQLVQDYSASNTYVFNVAAWPVGTYSIDVDVRTTTAVDRDAFVAIDYTIAPTVVAPAKSVTLVPNLASPQPASGPVTFTASASGSVGGYEYRFWVFDGANWQLVQNYSASNTWTMFGWPAGPYQVDVDVRTSPAVDRDTFLTIPYVLQ
jgi:hypothetical protein